MPTYGDYVDNASQSGKNAAFLKIHREQDRATKSESYKKVQSTLLEVKKLFREATDSKGIYPPQANMPGMKRMDKDWFIKLVKEKGIYNKDGV
jgi:hypothetical protein